MSYTCSKTVFTSAARTATHNSDDFVNPRWRGLHLVATATAETDTASVVFTVQGKDPTTGTYYTIGDSAALDAVGSVVLRIYPGLREETHAGSPTADVAARPGYVSDCLPEVWRVLATHSDADSITYAVGVTLLP